MSVTTTGVPRKAAVPQEPAQGPIFRSSTAAEYDSGSDGAANVDKPVPLDFKTVAVTPGMALSTIKQSVESVVASGSPLAIISRMAFCNSRIM
jgi:hypothetical protein